MTGCVVETVENEAELCRRAATAIADGKVVGWFQGRMEWGPRALGNRSILCDPRRGDIKDVLNAKIKRRESFRPFAPSVLDDAVAEWFEEDDAVPFMAQVFQIRERKAIANPRGHSCRRLRPFADRLSSHEPALLSIDRGVPRSDRNTAGAQHIVQRERADRLPSGGGARLLSAHQDGHARDRRHDHFARGINDVAGPRSTRSGAVISPGARIRHPSSPAAARSGIARSAACKDRIPGQGTATRPDCRCSASPTPCSIPGAGRRPAMPDVAAELRARRPVPAGSYKCGWLGSCL